MKIIAICSGGLDSTSMAKLLESQGHEVIPLSFSYGSKHNKRERESARMIFGDKLKEIDIDLSFLTKSSLINKDLEIAKQEYNADNVKQTVVYFRNGIMLAYATSLAEQEEADAVALGNHSADHTVYPDCRHNFIEAFNQATQAGTDKGIKVISPFCDIDKAEIINSVKGIPNIEEVLAKTYSCYEGGEIHCGICATCQERKRAFKQANLEDQTLYKVI